MAETTAIIVGGGLAGLAAAIALAPRGIEVTLVESKARLGGRASSFNDPTTGETIDLCQHVAMGCCTNFAHFCTTIGIRKFLEPQPTLYFMTPDRRVSRFAADPLPAPLHLARSFARLHSLTLGEKARIAYGLWQLKRPLRDADPPFSDWLAQHRQTPRTIDRFWGLGLTSALNETPDRIGVRYARKVFVDGFLGHRRGFEVELPTVPLGRLYGAELQAWLRDHRVTVRTGVGIKSFLGGSDRFTGVELLLEVLPESMIEREPYFANLRQLSHSPITSVHCWFDRPATELPHVVLVDCLGQWVFNRGRSGECEYYLQVVVSAARMLQGLGREEVERRVVGELRELFPALREAVLKRAKIITDGAATFSAAPGVDRWRPVQTSPLENFFVAGDWTSTGWPATMEGAVRSGYLAAEAVLRKLGIPASCVQPDLR